MPALYTYFRHFGATGFWMGVPQIVYKSKKRVWNTWFVDWFLMLKWEAWNGKKVFAWCLLQNRRFRRSGTLIEKRIPKWSKMELKSSLERSKVWPLSFWEAFENIIFLMKFSIGQKSAGLRSAKEVLSCNFWKGRRKGRGPLKLLNLQNTSVKSDTPLAPRSARRRRRIYVAGATNGRAPCCKHRIQLSQLNFLRICTEVRKMKPHDIKR